ncbi:carotenoid 9,10(9',10')-cleavage dioxygenase 1 [Marchantia polymorpha subsp. ruderalis]|uniref:carotenoid 9,10-dioxygenase n=2 Tax=Marchantia polymorpha TaxID=3197 RepID=A0AAF6BZ05_MARPO|nr:hypothetical protein MARPO_0003s0307 [Marchantia polymorpha]BBN17239.1 hypothetical protein Mp_7g12990 [Marchantia polymorpha subsp. ruderalis]|eukprot:PTQ49474.1 hypothetical protein MARPO_0003s0307 [Marchantia polymorpha]
MSGYISGLGASIQQSKYGSIEVDDLKKPKLEKEVGFFTRAASLFVDAIEKAAVWALCDPKAPPNYYLSGNYGPVDEFGPAQAILVKGTLPECLSGEFVRVGPNPKLKPVANYHWFDGDGMIHGLRIKDGKATYVCRYVRTAKLAQEEYWGASKFMKIGDLQGKAGLIWANIFKLRVKLGVLDTSNGMATANTAMVYHDGRLLSLSEGDKPYAVRVLEDGDLETIGRLDYEKKLNHNFTAHPKIDPDTGEMFCFGYSTIAHPYATYRVVSKDGVMSDPVPLTLSGPVMMHDMALTENYAIFLDCPLYFNPKDMVMKNQCIFSFDDTKPSRFGVLPRYAKNESQMIWFEVTTCVIFHNANAWEEGDEVVLVTCRIPSIDLGAIAVYDEVKVKKFVNDLWEYRFNMKTGKAVERKLGEFQSDFPRINEEYVGRKNRFVYAAVFEDATHINAVAKYDLTLEPELGKDQLEVGGNVAGVFRHGNRRYGSESVFVPKNPGREGEEDDGYLMCFVHDENTSISEVVVIDAKTMSPEPVAVVQLPTRVPFGFHAMHMTEEQVRNQKV